MIRKKKESTKDMVENDDIAIVGMAVNSSAGETAELFWESIKNNEDCINSIRGIRKEDLLAYLKRKSGSADRKFTENGLLQRIDQFDCEFFNIKMEDALCMGPGMRLHLQVMWHALEDAGYKEIDLNKEPVNIYTGIVTDDQIYEYREFVKEYDKSLLPKAMPGNLLPMISGRLAFYLNLTGATAVVDAACSSSSLALIQAANALKANQCKAAVIAGSRFIYNPEYDEDELIGIESEDNRTRTFDEYATGTAFGEGVFAIVVKKYSQAVKDHDRIYGIMKGYAVNQSGRTMKFGMPDYEAQMHVIEEGIRNAKLTSEDIQYCEAHGTGTYAGDYFEIMGIEKAFRKSTDKIGFCGIGSAKANLGHTYGASGLVSIIKCLLAMKYGYMPPMPHFVLPNKKINFIDSPLFVSTKLTNWDAKVRRCMVNCFGINGLNCNIVLQEYGEKKPKIEQDQNKRFFAITAKSKKSLQKLLGVYAAFLRVTEESIDDISYSMMVRRNHFRYRLLFLAEDREALFQTIQEVLSESGDEQFEKAVDGKRSFYGEGNKKKVIENGAFLEHYKLTGDDAACRKLCEWYLQGYAVDWRQLYGDSASYVSLPLYEFDMQRIWINEESLKKLRDNQKPAAGKKQKIRILSSSEITVVEKEIATIVCRLAGIEKLDVDENLFSLGINSIQGVKAVHEINERYGMDLSIVDLFEQDTIRKLASVMQMAKKRSAFQLVKAVKKAHYDLSSAQKRIYLLDRIEKNSRKNILQGAYIINGKMDLSRLEAAVRSVIRNNDILHTAFVDINGIPQQVVKEDWKFYLETGKQMQDIETEMRGFVSLFDFEKPPFFKIRILERQDGQSWFLFCAHHSIFDGTSIIQFLKELNDYYSGNKMLQKEYSYIDYTESMKAFYQTDAYIRQRAFWQKQYENGCVVSNLPKTYDIAEVARKDIGKKYFFEFSSDLTLKINQYAKKRGITVFMELYAALAVLLHKYSNDKEICIGVPYAGQNSAVAEKILGVFINTLAIRSCITGEQTVLEVISHIKEQCIYAFQNADFGYEELTEFAGGNLFQVMFIYQNMGERKVQFGNLTGEEYQLKESAAKYDMTIELYPVHQKIQGNIEYNTCLLSESYIAALVRHLQNIVYAFLRDDSLTVSEIPLMDTEEFRELLQMGRGATVKVTRNIIDLWYEALEKRNNQAVLFHWKEFSYEELEKMSNCVCQHIQQNSNQKEKTIPVFMHRGVSLIAALLGILKAGYSYIPLDPAYPQNRIAYILENSQAQILLTDRTCCYEDERIQKIYIEDILTDMDYATGCGRCNQAKMSEVCYTIYTSGTSGNPKGVSIRHRELANFIQAMRKIGQFQQSDRILCVTTVCFDIFVLECFCTLCSGALMVMADETECVDPDKLSELIIGSGVDTVQFTPSRMQAMLAVEAGRLALRQLKTVFLGGESLSMDILQQLRPLTQARIFNMYGPTETTVWSSYRDVTADETITIGKPIDNTYIYILTESGQLQYKGGIGEIGIGGFGVSAGYVNNQRLTDEKFISLPMCAGKVYKTGDLGRWDDSGNLVCFGRNDDQVKVRGYRVELGEVEEELAKHHSVQKAAVVDQKVDGNQVLLAFVQIKDGKKFEPEALMEYAASRLPFYMIPYAMIQIEQFPMTPNGKMDRKALRQQEVAIQISKQKTALSQPVNAIEQVLFGIWKQILGKENIGCEQSFFHAGGNSMLLIMLLNEIKKRYPIDVSAADLYDAKTIRAIAQQIRQKMDQENTNVQIEEEDVAPFSDSPYYPLSGAQLRLYLLEQMDPVKCKYNVTAAFIVEGTLDIDRLERALNVVISRHEILRTSFLMVGQEPMQKIHEYVVLKIERKDFILHVDDQIRAFIRAFDLERPPLIRALVGKIDQQRSLFLFDMHHLITDGTSAQLLIREVEKIYNGEMLGPPAYQYRDFCREFLKRKKSAEYQKQERYWKNIFKKEYKKANLPTFHAGSKNLAEQGKKYYFEIDPEIYQIMQKFAKSNDYTIFMITVTVLNILIYKYTGASDITVGTPVFGRNSKKDQETLGVFVNTLVLRNFLESSMSVREILDTAKKMCLEAFSNADYGFEDLVQQVHVTRDLDKNPLFDIMFIYQIFGEKEVCLDGAKLTKYPIKDIIPKYEISFEMIPDRDRIYCVIEYDCQLYSQQYIDDFAKNYLHILTEILAERKQLLREVEVDNRMQQKQVLALGKGRKYEVNDTVIDKWYNRLMKNLQYREHIAVFCGGIEYTYQELEHVSNQIAHYLLTHYSGSNMVFGILLKREFLLIAALFGVLKAGGSYIPIDISYPKSRVKYILEHTNAVAYLYSDSVAEKIRSPKAISVKKIIENDHECSAVNQCVPEKNAYTIFTSGSTGKPKGVIIGQRAMSNFVQSMQRIAPFDENSVMLGVTTIAFDIFVLECFVTLCYGGKLVLAKEKEITDVGRLSGLIQTTGVNRIQFTPSRILMLLEIPEYAHCLQQVETAFIGGEAFADDTLKRLRQYTKARILNVYGPTETTVWSTYKDVTNEETVTIGRPLDNTDLYILDSDEQLMFRNGIGELAIGGLGVAEGYYGQDELTKERFIHTEFAPGIIYKTGDLAGWNDVGDLCCFGRLDHQVKIRGYRVELGEIEAAILSYNEAAKNGTIKTAAAVVKDLDGIKELYAFVVWSQITSSTNTDDLRQFLESRLPAYMIPKVITVLDQMPFTENGKIDRNELLKYQTEEVAIEGMAAPENTIEEELLKIWQNVLNIEQISCTKKFFDIGGNSLLLIKMLKLIREKYPVAITAGDLFQLQTIRNTAQELYRRTVDQQLYFAEIEVPDLFMGGQQRNGMVVKESRFPSAEKKANSCAAFIKSFANVLFLLNGKEKIGINISTEKDKCTALCILAEDAGGVESEKVISAALKESGLHMSVYQNKIRKNVLKVLFAVGYRPNYDMLMHTFDAVILMKVADDSFIVQLISNQKRIKKEAMNYVWEKTELLYKETAI